MAVIGYSSRDFEVVTSLRSSAPDSLLPFVVVVRGTPSRGSAIATDTRRSAADADGDWTSSWSSERGTIEFNHVADIVRIDGEGHVKPADVGTFVLLVDASGPRTTVQGITVGGIPAPRRRSVGRRPSSWPMRMWKRLQRIREQLGHDDTWFTTVLNEPAVSAFLSRSVGSVR